MEQATQSESIAALAGALSKAQAEIKGAEKDKSNPYFKSKYADLSSIWDACKEPLTQNGLAVIQTTELNGGNVVVVTTLAHESGEWIRGKLGLKPVKEDPQSAGSALTYARRYALAAIVGVCPDDDDAEDAMARNSKASAKGAITKETVTAVMDSAQLPPIDEKAVMAEIAAAEHVSDLGNIANNHKRALNAAKVNNPALYAKIREALSARKLELMGDMAGAGFVPPNGTNGKSETPVLDDEIPW